MRSRPARRRSVHEAAPSSAQLVAAIVELRQQAALRTPSAPAAPQSIVPRGPGGDILSIDYDIFALTETLQEDVTQRSSVPGGVIEHVDGEGEGRGKGEDEDEGALSSAAERAAIQTVERSFAATGLCGGTLGLDPVTVNAFAALVIRSYATRRHTMPWAAAGMPKPVAPQMPPYHNAFHAADVVQAAATLLHVADPAPEPRLPPSSRLALLIAALCHDVGHAGLTNRFLRAARDQNQIQDRNATKAEIGIGCQGGADIHCACPSQVRSPPAGRAGSYPLRLEEMHAAICEELLTQTGAGRAILTAAVRAMLSESQAKGGHAADAPLSPQQHRAHWLGLVRRCILDTDMDSHDAVLADLKAFGMHDSAGHPGSADGAVAHVREPEQLLLSSMLKAADISNVARPMSTSRAWAQRLSTEFRFEGDAERALGLPVTHMNDRHLRSSAPANLTSGFIRFVATPYYAAIAAAVPSLLRAMAADTTATTTVSVPPRANAGASAHPALTRIAERVRTNGDRWFLEAAAHSVVQAGPSASCVPVPTVSPPAPPSIRIATPAVPTAQTQPTPRSGHSSIGAARLFRRCDKPAAGLTVDTEHLRCARSTRRLSWPARPLQGCTTPVWRRSASSSGSSTCSSPPQLMSPPAAAEVHKLLPSFMLGGSQTRRRRWSCPGAV